MLNSPPTNVSHIISQSQVTQSSLQEFWKTNVSSSLCYERQCQSPRKTSEGNTIGVAYNNICPWSIQFATKYPFKILPTTTWITLTPPRGRNSNASSSVCSYLQILSLFSSTFFILAKYAEQNLPFFPFLSVQFNDINYIQNIV